MPVVLPCWYNGCTVAVVDTPPKSERFSMRVEASQNCLISRAAAELAVSKTEFVSRAALVEAQRVLADRSTFFLDDKQWVEFNRLLDRPARDNPRLAKLFSRPSVFE